MFHPIAAAVLAAFFMSGESRTAFAGEAWAPPHEETPQHHWLTGCPTPVTNEDCCGPTETVRISRGQAARARLGSVITATFPDGKTRAVTIKTLCVSRDPEQRPWLSFRGCLWRGAGG